MYIAKCVLAPARLIGSFRSGDTKGMPHFVVLATDRAGYSDLRARIRPEHRVYLRSHGCPALRVVLAGPTLEPSAGQMNGTFLIVEAPTLDDVMKFISGDPYARAGLFADVKIRAWVCGLGSLAEPEKSFLLGQGAAEGLQIPQTQTTE